ncbi:lasso peptide biosynthesis PqqD family chaperone [Mesobacillus foraminis]|uniref:lasso peptide biosynthesis PqqD family chaperone n=1 Tax=Mesobacillus foraminis TaxID=279826 RepID=UPI000EF52CAE|nr:lasso peptide biosynthesis PqqD family chaperone [Mesobacillus foraminis]
MLETKKISLGSKLVIAPGNIVSDMGGEKVMMNIEKGKYYNLGETGGVIWRFLESPIIVGELINKLVSEFQVEQSQCEQEVISFLELLNNEELVQFVE